MIRPHSDTGQSGAPRGGPCPSALAGRAALAVVLALACVGGCRQIVGIKSRRAATAPAGQSASCLQCISSSCAAEAATCDESSSCNERASCLATCPGADAACEAACTLDTGGTPYDSIAGLGSCRASSCSAECELRCGNVPPLVDTPSAGGCQACLADACCDLLTACGTSVDCRRIVECTRGQTTPDAIQGCQRVRYPSAAGAYAAVDSCMLGKCAYDCAYGANWTCLGQVHFPVPTLAQLAFTVQVVDSAQQPLSGIQAVACIGSDLACSHPAGAGLSGADGRASLLVDASSVLGPAAFDGIVRLTDPTGNRLVTLVNIFPPLTESGVEFPAIVAEPEDLASIATLLHETVDPARGQIIATAFDCVARRAPGLHVELSPPDAEAHVVYTLGTIPARNATQTDSSGNSLVVNAPPGLITLLAKRDDGTVVSRTQVVAAAGEVTIAIIAPTPL